MKYLNAPDFMCGLEIAKFYKENGEWRVLAWDAWKKEWVDIPLKGTKLIE